MTENKIAPGVYLPKYIDPKIVNLMEGKCTCGKWSPPTASQCVPMRNLDGTPRPPLNWICPHCGKDWTPRCDEEEYEKATEIELSKEGFDTLWSELLKIFGRFGGKATYPYSIDSQRKKLVVRCKE